MRRRCSRYMARSRLSVRYVRDPFTAVFWLEGRELTKQVTIDILDDSSRQNDGVSNDPSLCLIRLSTSLYQSTTP